MPLSSHLRASLYALVALTGITPLCKADTFATNATEYFIQADNSTDTYIPLDFSDINHWQPADAYKGLPMKAPEDGSDDHFEVDIAALSLDEFKDYFLTSDSFANFTFTDEAIEEQRAMLLNTTLPPAPQVKCRDPNDKRCIGFGPPCGDTINYHFVSHTVAQNLDVWGGYHYMSDKICGPTGGSYTRSITHNSGITISGSANPAAVGKGGATKALTTFLSVFGISVSGPAPDSVSLGHTYSVNCPNRHVCFLYERPHLAVYQGWTQANAYDPQYNTACPRFNKRWNWNVHTVWPANSARVSASWGQCYSKNGHGCGWPPLASPANSYCPNPNM
ncbi:hypothetical protein BP5796_03700 [Coleophoma crateriformis]|uniref:Uncharacterized protein n=1 Tax=Coleophoma crateriformis TaxID=565419 RepID=A0A3D8SGA3_9HELO|nr:hypothetical protein BP5796_03700 [Coleophoma crateriformis]